MKTYLFYILILLLAGASMYSITWSRFNDVSNGKNASAEYKTTVITINNRQIKVAIADTNAKRALGLSNQPSLGENNGLLFIFDQSEQHGFWMKEMNFPIDIIWFSADKKIADITANLATSTYPNTVTSRVPAQYVLEVNAGWAEESGLKIGDQVSW